MITSVILAKIGPWLGMAIAFIAAYFGIRSSKRRADRVQAQADQSVANATVAAQSQEAAQKQVSQVAKESANVNSEVSSKSDDDVSNELLANWSRDSDTKSGSN